MPEGKIVKALSGFYYVQHEEGITMPWAWCVQKK